MQDLKLTLTTMTKQELNRDCKRLVKQFKDGKQYTDEFTAEFKRIYYADSGFEYLSPKNALSLIRINLSLRIIALHQMGLAYEL